MKMDSRSASRLYQPLYWITDSQFLEDIQPSKPPLTKGSEQGNDTEMQTLTWGEFEYKRATILHSSSAEFN